MAIPGTTSALIAAFVFGIVLAAASAILVLIIQGHGSSIFRDGKRLVLALFLLSAALWAQTDFITTLIDPSAPASCQIGVVFTTVFDLFARVAIEQHLLWVIIVGSRPGLLQYMLQALLLGRFILGIVFVALTKFEFNSVCVPVSSNGAVAIVTVAVDAVVLVGLFIKTITSGVFTKMEHGGQSSSRGKAIVAVLMGFGFWLGTSVPMLLGWAGVDYLVRSAIPAGGLVVLIIIVAAASNSLVAPELRRDQERRMPEAPSPRMMTTGLFDSTPADLNDYPPNRYEEIKGEAFGQSREAPQPGDVMGVPRGFSMQKVPGGANASVGQGVFGVPVQGALFPPMRAESERPQPAAPRELPQQPKRAFFDSGKGPARSITVGAKLAISNPVLQEGGSNPLDKVATTDLATAAQMDRQKRVFQAAQMDPIMTNVDSKQGLIRSISTTRKGVAGEEFRPDSEVLATAAATGSQMSPSGDELRRRSPRQSSGNGNLTRPESRTPPLPLKSPSRLKHQMPPGPEPVAEAHPETTLQRRPTVGIPMNPKTRSVRRPNAPEDGRKQQETVLFVNDIVYNDPAFVASVMEGAKDRGAKPKPSMVLRPEVDSADDEMVLIPQVGPLPEVPLTASSVVHRPRPIPRRTDSDGRDTFYPLTSHRRSKSVGHMRQRKSFLQDPGSPTTLPPLPPPPMSANFQRPHPNNTKSMTYSEKVQLLFPPQDRPKQSDRRSSVPDLMGSYMNDSPTLTANETRDFDSRDSKQTSSSVQTRSIFGMQDQGSQREQSMATYCDLMDGSEEQRCGHESAKEGSISYANKRASSPVLPIFGDLRSATTADADDMTTFGSIYSPAHVQQVGLTPGQARAIEVTRGGQPSTDPPTASHSGEELLFMLDTSVVAECQKARGENAPGSPVDDGTPVEETTSTRSSGPWHQRVGSKTLSFSGNSDKRRSKRGPPPTPLALSDRPTQAKQIALAKDAELSPLPSPDAALKLIQAQLQRYEQADRAPAGSPGRQALLNDLEAEMGQQESRWLGMQNRFTQDSMASLDMSPTAESRRTSAAVGESSVALGVSRNSTRSMMSMLRRTRQGSIAASIMSLTNEDDGVPFGSRASLWQKRLAAAHQEFESLNHGTEIGSMYNKNFLTLSPGNTGSPTPPDSGESESEAASRRKLKEVMARRAMEEAARQEAVANSLWKAPQPEQEYAGLMWVRPEKPYHVPVAEPELPGVALRPVQRRLDRPLSIASKQLWQKTVAKVSPSASQLWVRSAMVGQPEVSSAIAATPDATASSSYHNPGIPRSQTVSGRPLTQRPPRRSRRITALPDIIEDPVPLPNKRDTLGIFQFPWGEKSDVPSVPQRPVYRTMAGTMSSGSVRGRAEQRSREIEQMEYSSSFFDDYEEDEEDAEDEEEDYSDSDSMGSESDDGFDETTLFEIANLLKTNDVPSTRSFFGEARDFGGSSGSAADPYMTEEQRNDRDMLVVEEETEGLQRMPSPLPPAETRSLWEDDSSDEEDERGAHGQGLPQPQDWHRYSQMTDTIRAKPRASMEPTSVGSDNLWIPANRKTDSISRSSMWSPPDSPTKSMLAETTVSPEEPSAVTEARRDVSVSSSLPLWQAQPQQLERGDHGVGLPHPEDWMKLAGAPSTARAKPRQSQIAVIESAELWAVSGPELSSSPLNMWAAKDQPAPVTRAVSPQKPAVRQVKEPSKFLWSAPSSSPKDMTDGGLFSIGTGRTVFRTTTQVPAAIHMDRKARLPAQTVLDRLESSALWAPATGQTADRHWISVKVITTKAMPMEVMPAEVMPTASSSSSSQQLLWSPPASPKDLIAFGLFDAKSPRSDFRTTSQPAAAVDMHRVARSPQQKPLDRLVSTALWASTARPVTEKNWIWISTEASIAPKVSISAKVSRSPMIRMLWSAPSSPLSGADNGLFTTSGRTIFKTTTKAPAAVEMARNSRSTETKPLDRLASNSLWASATGPKTEKHWLSIKTSGPRSSLWSAPASPIEASGPGLFAKSARTVFKTTSLAPAALEITRKPRSGEEVSLDQLASTSLWAREIKKTSERNWISSASSSGASTPKLSQVPEATAQMWQNALEEAVAASYPAISVQKASPAISEQWVEALTQAVAASYPVRHVAARKPPTKATPADWAAALAEAVSMSYSKPFDASRRHPVFAGSSLTTTASDIHPAAIGYTAHTVASVHPVFFSAGAGVAAHPAVPAEAVAAPKVVEAVQDEVVYNDVVQNKAVKNLAQSGSGRGSRIMAMASMFEKDKQAAPLSRSFSIAKKPSVRRAPTPPRPASPEPQVLEEPQAVEEPQVFEEPQVVAELQVVEEPQAVEEPQPISSVQHEDEGRDASLLVQTEALEQERVFAEQWAAGTFNPVEDVAEPFPGVLAPSPVIIPGTAAKAPSSPNKAEQLARDLFTPEPPSPVPYFLEPKTYVSPQTPSRKQQPLSAEELGEQMFTPKDMSPVTPPAPLSVKVATEAMSPAGLQMVTPPPKAPEQQQQQQQQQQQPQAPRVAQIAQLQRSSSVKSAVSALSDSEDTVTLRDSLVSVDSNRDTRTSGLALQFRYQG